ncbi:MAG TPA: tripartite tricarboxylate transporter TctB family protein [Ramlibacter sp.]|nr:tripartite tricarboxylate transporter TctB family protein [Ramlibacter sp.]
MNDRNLMRGLVLVAISLAFGLTSLHYPIGDFSRAGAGLFPLMVSCMLLAVGIATVIRSRFTASVPLGFSLKNILVIIAALCGFSLASHFIDMLAGVVVLVFIGSLAATSYSVMRNARIAVGLIVVAFCFQKFLGLQLPLI